MNQHDKDGLSELEQVGITINELDSTVLKKMVSKDNMYRFVRTGDSIYVSSINHDHGDIVIQSKIEIDEVSDGGFFMVTQGKVVVNRFSKYLETQGIDRAVQISAHSETANVLKIKMKEAGLDYRVGSHK